MLFAFLGVAPIQQELSWRDETRDASNRMGVNTTNPSQNLMKTIKSDDGEYECITHRRLLSIAWVIANGPVMFMNLHQVEGNRNPARARRFKG
jgi:hypothetical protein